MKTQKVRLVFNRNTVDNFIIDMTEGEIWARWPQVPKEGEYETEDGLLNNGSFLESRSAECGSSWGKLTRTTPSLNFLEREARDYEVRVYYSKGL